MESIYEKNSGKKSRATVPLRYFLLGLMHCKTISKDWLHLYCQLRKTQHLYHSCNSFNKFTKYENPKFSTEVITLLSHTVKNINM
jgi:hypothetical protein